MPTCSYCYKSISEEEAESCVRYTEQDKKEGRLSRRYYFVCKSCSSEWNMATLPPVVLWVLLGLIITLIVIESVYLIMH